MLATVDITLRVMHHAERDVYDQNQPPRTKRPCGWVVCSTRPLALNAVVSAIVGSMLFAT